jgi:GDP-L-fucose synthase
MHVDDLASAVVFLLEHYDDPETINVGSGQEISISDLAHLIAEIVGFDGSIDHDLSQPDGTPRKMLDSSRLHALGWKPRWELREGIADAYEWFSQNPAILRSV